MKSLIFTAENVPRILDGTKTQTRRMAMMRTCEGIVPLSIGKGNVVTGQPSTTARVLELASEYTGREVKPFAVPGEIRYVRETFRDARHAAAGRILYRANEEDFACGWTSPLHMREEQSRIKLKITAIRLEWLQDISEEDCLAEGIRIPHDGKGHLLINISAKYTPGQYLSEQDRIRIKLNQPIGRAWLRAHYAALWDSINLKSNIENRKCGWAANPWVWVIDFQKFEIGNLK